MSDKGSECPYDCRCMVSDEFKLLAWDKREESWQVFIFHEDRYWAVRDMFIDGKDYWGNFERWSLMDDKEQT